MKLIDLHESANNGVVWEKTGTEWLNNAKELSEEIKKNCSDYLSSGSIIYRGINSKVSLIKIDTSGMSRKSRDGDNGPFNFLFDRAATKIGMARRSKSIICTNSYTNSAEYGSIYLVIPENDAKICMVPSSDIQNVKVEFFNEKIFTSGVSSGISQIIANPLDYKEYEKVQHLIDRNIYTYKEFKAFFDQATENQFKNFLSTIDNDIDPINLGFRSLTPKDKISHRLNQTREICIEGKAYMIKLEHIDLFNRETGLEIPDK